MRVSGSRVYESKPVFPASDRLPVSKGLGAVSDRLEVSRRLEEDPPSKFKKFLFDPLVNCFRWLLRGAFLFTEALWAFAFDETASNENRIEREKLAESKPLSEEKRLLDRLRAAPTKEELFAQFERVVNETERREIYRLLGAAYPRKLSWKEYFSGRSALQNEAIGRQLAQANPQKIKGQLEAALARMP